MFVDWHKFVDWYNTFMLKIRLARIGKKKKPTYRFIVSEAGRDPFGKALEFLGHYNPASKVCEVKKDRILHWISKGAKASPTVHNLLIDQNVITGEKVKASKAGKKSEGQKSKGEAKATKPEESQAEAKPAKEAKPEESQAKEKPEVKSKPEAVKEEPKKEEKPEEKSAEPKPKKPEKKKEEIKEEKTVESA